MTKFDFFVEEESMQITLNNIIYKIIPHTITLKIHPFQGKRDLLNNLPERLRGLRYRRGDDWKIIVLIDEDRQNCIDLKNTLNNIVIESGLICKTHKQNNHFHVLNRIVIEELEAWFFGDPDAVENAYPNIRKTSLRRYSISPDTINGGTFETLERLLKYSGYYSSGIPKTEVAQKISTHMNININKSKSFNVFRDGLLDCV